MHCVFLTLHALCALTLGLSKNLEQFLSSQVFSQLSKRRRKKNTVLILLSATCSATTSFRCIFLWDNTKDMTCTYTRSRKSAFNIFCSFVRCHRHCDGFLGFIRSLCRPMCHGSIVFVLHLSSVYRRLLICYCGWECIETNQSRFAYMHLPLDVKYKKGKRRENKTATQRSRRVEWLQQMIHTYWNLCMSLLLIAHLASPNFLSIDSTWNVDIASDLFALYRSSPCTSSAPSACSHHNAIRQCFYLSSTVLSRWYKFWNFHISKLHRFCHRRNKLLSTTRRCLHTINIYVL